MDKPTLNVILDERRIEKYDPLISELRRQKIKYEIWPCILRPNVVSSINASHKMIVRDAKEKGLKECFVGEDDLMFPAADGWQYFLKNKPTSYDLYLACTYVVPISNNRVCGFHLYAISDKFYDQFLSIPDDVHIDTYMDELKGDYHFCYPFPALQRPGFSSNNMAISNYNAVLKPEDIYGQH
jgi:hypothetical protein